MASSLGITPIGIVATVLILLLVLVVVFEFVVGRAITGALGLEVYGLLSRFFTGTLVILHSLGST